VAFNRPVVAVIAHWIVLQWSDPISELVNMHNCDRWLAMTRIGPSPYAEHVDSYAISPCESLRNLTL
ncbi:hypothetical protein, partial [Bradyrhizobium sp. 157]|uniref:hypothetical protein n=1 Tax=Bradyrhizobium sp. 157 TaxID=2782631 RepID=UPI001FF94E5A